MSGRPFTPVDECWVDVTRARVYEHGWQSWSPTTTYSVTDTSARPALGWQQVMRFRPETPAPAAGFQAEGLLVVEPEPGRQRVYAAADPRTEIPSIRAELHGNRLVVSADGPVRSHDTEGTLGRALERYGDETAAFFGVEPRPAPTVWCSWYRYFLDVTEDDIVENLDAIGRDDLPVEVVQIDDGWQAMVGDWRSLSDRFRSLRDLAGRIRDTGRRAGIWLAPFTALERSELARREPEWLHGEAGWNWDQQMWGLDLERGDVRDHLGEVFGMLRVAGFDYFKLDFLYAGALAGTGGRAGPEAVSAYRSGLRTIREAVGPESYLLGCGAPILPSVGLVDAMRVSPDTYNPTDVADGHNPLRGQACIEGRAWQQGRFWVNDSDCLIVRPGFGRREEWARLIERYGGLRSCSDRIEELDDWGLDTLRRLLGSPPPPTPFRPLPDAMEK